MPTCHNPVTVEAKEATAITVMRCMLTAYAEDKRIPFEQAMLDFEDATKTQDIKRIAETDMVFHDIIYDATRNPKLVNILNLQLLYIQG